MSINARADRDALAAAVEHYAAQRQELRALLIHVAERLDDFTYDELAAIIDDEPLDQWGERYRADGRPLYGPLTPILDLDGQPIVRTVGDLTARHIGRRVRVGKTPPATLMGLSWREVGVRVHLFTPDAEAAWQNLPLNTPCEVLP